MLDDLQSRCHAEGLVSAECESGASPSLRDRYNDWPYLRWASGSRGTGYRKQPFFVMAHSRLIELHCSLLSFCQPVSLYMDIGICIVESMSAPCLSIALKTKFTVYLLFKASMSALYLTMNELNIIQHFSIFHCLFP